MDGRFKYLNKNFKKEMSQVSLYTALVGGETTVPTVLIILLLMFASQERLEILFITAIFASLLKGY